MRAGAVEAVADLAEQVELGLARPLRSPVARAGPQLVHREDEDEVEDRSVSTNVITAVRKLPKSR